MKESIDDELFDRPEHRSISVLPIIFWVLLIALGGIMKLQHYPGSSFTMITGTGALFGYGLWKGFYLKWENGMSLVLVVVSAAWMLFAMYRLFFALPAFIILTMAALISFMLYRWVDRRKRKTQS
ncbi:hypothetical protein KFE98_09675 [bacterium SCSIO 12741]|nr:hypothetical protein KFE98_09675 [bacterium SCSIO 12741]